MTGVPSIIWSVFFFALAISPLVFIHELGHYLVGRWFGVKAEVFSIGFGRKIAGWTDRRGTDWRIGWLPMGGYVRFAGDMNAAGVPGDEWLMLPPEARAQTLQAKPVWQRALIVAAGPAANFLFAIAALAALFGVYGEPRTPPVIAQVVAKSAAAAAELRAGDRVVAIDGELVDRFEQIARAAQLNPGVPLSIVVERGGARTVLTATPRPDILRDRFGNELRRGLLGIGAGERVVVRLAPHEMVGAALRFTGESVRLMATTLWQVASGTRSVKELGGPVKIAQVSGQQATLGPIDFLFLMVMISINLGFINLLPIPMLDGGHLAFFAAEAIGGKPVGARVQDLAYRSGLALLLAFTVFVTVNDLEGLGVWRRLAGLIG